MKHNLLHTHIFGNLKNCMIVIRRAMHTSTGIKPYQMKCGSIFLRTLTPFSKDRILVEVSRTNFVIYLFQWLPDNTTGTHDEMTRLR